MSRGNCFYSAVFFVALLVSLLSAFLFKDGLLTRTQSPADSYQKGRIAGVARTVPVFRFRGQVVYSGPDHNLWLLDGQTGQRQQITLDGSRDGKRYFIPVWSPDGKNLLYTCREPGGGQNTVFITEAETLRTKTIGQGWDVGPFAWSPDGSKIAYSNFMSDSPQAEKQGIWLFELQTGKVELLKETKQGTALYGPRWAPKGEMISFRAYCMECAGQFSTLDLSPNRFRYDWAMTGTDQWVGLNSDWSPDGEWIAYDQESPANKPGETHGLWRGTADGERIGEIYRVEGKTAGFPKWSPDGKRIAFRLVTYSKGQGGFQAQSNLMVINADGSEPRTLYESPKEVWPQGWSEDGQQLLFIEEGQNDSDPLRNHYADALMVYEFGQTKPFQIAEMERTGGVALRPKLMPAFFPAEERASAPEMVEAEDPLPLNEETLLYLQSGMTLGLHNLTEDQQIDIPSAARVKAFSLSPRQRHIFYLDPVGKGHLLRLNPGADGRLTTEDLMLTGEPDQIAVQSAAEEGIGRSYSPDETRFAFRDRFGRVWMIGTQDGSQMQLPYAAGAPIWSKDGHWFSFVSLDGRLYLSAKDGIAQQIADNVSVGSVQWSPTQGMLAYARHMPGKPGLAPEHETLVYRLANRKSYRVMEKANLIGWSRDGQLLAVETTLHTGTPQAVKIQYVVNAMNGKYVEVGKSSVQDATRRGWVWIDQPYLFGAFRVAGDLSKVQQLAPMVLSASADGQVFLGADRTDFNRTDSSTHVSVYCWREAGQMHRQLAELQVGPSKGFAMPALWGHLSADGRWAAVSYLSDSKINLLVARCDKEYKISVPSDDWPVRSGQSPFSPNGHWLVANVRDGEDATVQIRSLRDDGVGARVNLPSVPNAPFYFWAPAESGSAAQ